jgi:mono/diheme cytochrome c family protein
MPAWGDKLSAQEIDDVVTWVTSLWSDEIHLLWVTKVEQAQN